MKHESHVPATPPAQRTDAIFRYMGNDQFATRANIELLSVSPGQAHAKMVLGPQHLNGFGTVMGGAIFTLADYAFAAACNSHGTVAVAVNVSITYLKAATSGTLWADAREISKNFKLGSYTVDVKDDQGNLIALFQGLAYRKQDRIEDIAPPQKAGNPDH
jgi:acyl-CoA thioesterase